LLQDRFGAFLAIKWPGGAVQTGYELEIIQDIFPAVFSYLYEDEDEDEDMMEHVLPRLSTKRHFAGVHIRDGLIVGGRDDGEPLYLRDPLDDRAPIPREVEGASE
jgi:hypothetical protein